MNVRAMSSNQETFSEFPQDGYLWAIKHIDQFQQQHPNSRSASVTVMLQRLPEMSLEQLANMTPEQCQDILGKRFHDPWPQLEFVRVLIGSLPVLTTGFVFRNGVKVGVLPWTRYIISLAPGQSDERDMAASQEVEKPPNWGDYPHRALNPCEYFGLVDHNRQNVYFSRSRLVTFRYRQGCDTDIIIIPRMTILKAFYAQHIQIIKAMCPGPWSRYLKDVICLTEPASGLKTESINDGEQWNILLQTGVPDDYAELLAVLYFDDYARTCAESMYTLAGQDGNGNWRQPWFAAARIPFQVTQGKLDLAVKCLKLKERSYRNEAGLLCRARKYLVTEICGSSWPEQYPIIGKGRTNDGSDGEDVESVAEAAPFANNHHQRDGDASTIITQNCDAHTMASTTSLIGSQWEWLGKGPMTVKLQKLHSKRFEGRVPLPDKDGDLVSPGAHTYRSDGLPKAETKTLVRVPNQRFDDIVRVLTGLKQHGPVDDLRDFAPRHPGQLSDRSGYRCWKFIDAESLHYGRSVRPGWRAIYTNPPSRRHAHYRTALVLRLVVMGKVLFWIEIEHRDSDNFCSVLLSYVDDDEHALIERVLEVIAEAEGKRLHQRINQALYDETVMIDTYRHDYNDERTGVTSMSVYNALRRTWC